MGGDVVGGGGGGGWVGGAAGFLGAIVSVKSTGVARKGLWRISKPPIASQVGYEISDARIFYVLL